MNKSTDFMKKNTKNVEKNCFGNENVTNKNMNYGDTKTKYVTKKRNIS